MIRRTGEPAKRARQTGGYGERRGENGDVSSQEGRGTNWLKSAGAAYSEDHIHLFAISYALLYVWGSRLDADGIVSRRREETIEH